MQLKKLIFLNIKNLKPIFGCFSQFAPLTLEYFAAARVGAWLSARPSAGALALSMQPEILKIVKKI